MSSTQLTSALDCSPSASRDDAHHKSDLVKHAHLYYPDGNICLLTDKTVFRCLKSMLAQASERLKEEFEALFEEREVSPNSYEGATMMKVEGSTEDWETLLSFLWRRSPTGVREAWSMLRVAHSYRFTAVRKIAVDQLKSHLGPTAAATALATYRTGRICPLDAIRDAKACEVPEILPMAFYAAAFFVMDDQTTYKDIAIMGLDMDDVLRLQTGRQQIKAQWWKFVELGPDFVTCHCSLPWSPGDSSMEDNTAASLSTAFPATLTTAQLLRALADQGDPLKYLDAPVTWSARLKSRANLLAKRSCAQCTARQSHTRLVYWKSITNGLSIFFSL